MKQGRLYQCALAAVMAVMLLSVSFTQQSLNTDRERLKLTRLPPVENMPPILSITTVALGGFRGLIANLLWMRANDLQQDEKFFEAVQLADWITKLQPHIAIVWVHQAWNMAYNISVKFPDQRDRWAWVRRGIELLRDEGLKYNPQEPLIYRELAWFFQHKMGANLDNAHVYYKLQWAQEMIKLFGFTGMNWEELLNPQTDDARARVKQLREVYKMDPRFMKEVDTDYGPLEWRLPETHAIYWGTYGLKHAKPEEQITLRRVIYQSLSLAAMRGKLMPNSADRIFEFGPNLTVIPRANKAYEQMLDEDPKFHDNIKNAHHNFLKQAVGDLYLHNREQDAARWYKYARDKYPDYFKVADLHTFALDRYAENIDAGGVDRNKNTIEGLLERSLYYEATGEDDLAYGYIRRAQQCWTRHEIKVQVAETNRINLPPMSILLTNAWRNVVLEPPPRGWSLPLKAMMFTKRGLPMPANLLAAATATNAPGFTAPTSDGLSAPERNRKQGEAFLAQNKLQPGVKTTSSGLQYKVLRAGTGKTPGNDDTVRVNYRGTLVNGAEFDKSKGGPTEFGVTGVIRGWTEALKLMKEGAQWQLFIPPQLAYGERGNPSIGPNSTLIFEVELVEIKK